MSSVSNTERLRSQLNAAKEDQGFTLDNIVARTEGRLRRSRAENLLKELYRAHPLSRDDLLLIAEGFGVDYDGLRVAHLADMGLLGEDPSDASIGIQLPAGTDRLTSKQRSAVRAVIRAMVDPEPDARLAGLISHEADTADEVRSSVRRSTQSVSPPPERGKAGAKVRPARPT